MEIGQVVQDKEYKGEVGVITNLTSNTIEVFLNKKTKKGVDCTHWFTDKEFKLRFDE